MAKRGYVYAGRYGRQAREGVHGRQQAEEVGTRLCLLEVGHLKGLAFAGGLEHSDGKGSPHCATLRPRPLVSQVVLAVSQLLGHGSQTCRQASSMVSTLKDTAVTGFLLIPVGKLRHGACAERWGARHGTQPTLSHPCLGCGISCSSFPAPAPGGPQASAGGGGGGPRHALTQGAGYCLSPTDAEPASLLGLTKPQVR